MGLKVAGVLATAFFSPKFPRKISTTAVIACTLKTSLQDQGETFDIVVTG